MPTDELVRWIPPLLAIAAVIWRGSALTSQLDAAIKRVDKIEVGHAQTQDHETRLRLVEREVKSQESRIERLEERISREGTGKHPAVPT